MVSIASTCNSPMEIHPDVLYEHSEALRRLRWGKSAFRTARRNGLPVSYISRRAYVYGQDLIDYIRRSGVERN
jgi:hypothetical protein